MMYLFVLVGLIVFGAIGALILTRETSFLYIAPLLALITLGFLSAFFFRTAIVLFFFSLVTGVYLAWLARDELQPGRIWFMAIMVFSFISCFLFSYRGNPILAGASLCIFLGTLPALVLSYDPRWVRRRGHWESKV